MPRIRKPSNWYILIISRDVQLSANMPTQTVPYMYEQNPAIPELTGNYSSSIEEKQKIVLYST